MNVDIQDFLSNDESKRDLATQLIMNATEDQNYMFTLLDQMKNQEGLDNNYISAFSLIIVFIVRNKWNTGFFTDESEAKIIENITEIAYNSSDSIKSNVLEVFSIIFSKYCNDTSTLLINCINTLHYSQDLSRIKTSLEVLERWVYFHTLKTDLITDEVKTIVKNIIQFFPHISGLFSNSKDYPLIILQIALITKNSLFKINELFEMPEFITIFEYLLSVFQVNNDSQMIQDLKCEVILIFMILLEKSTKFKDFSFHTLYFSSLIPGLVHFIYAEFSSISSRYLLAKMLECISILINYNVMVETFTTQVFVHDILLSSCLLQEEDIETYCQIPDQFIAFNYPIEKNKIISPRLAVASVIDSFANEIALNPILDQIIQIAQDCDDLESSLFLIGCIAKYRNKSKEILHFILSVLQKTESAIIQSTCLFGLQQFSIEKRQLNEIGLYFLINSNDIVQKLLGIYVFMRSYDAMITVINEPLELIINSLLGLASNSSDTRPGDMMLLLVSQYKGKFLPVILELVPTLFKAWNISRNACDDQAIGGIDYLLCVDHLINSLEENSELVQQLSPYVFNFCVESFLESNAEVQLLAILNSMVQKMENVGQEFFNLIPFFGSICIENSLFFMLNDFCALFISLTEKSSFDIDQANYLVSFSYSLLESECCEAISTGFLIFSHLIQKFGDSFINVLDSSNQFVLNEEPSIVISISCLFSSVIISIDNFNQVLNEEHINYIIQNIPKIKNAPYNYMKLIVMALNQLKNIYNTQQILMDLAGSLMSQKRAEDIEDIDDEELSSLIDHFCDDEVSSTIELIEINFPSNSFDILPILEEIAPEQAGTINRARELFE